MQAPAGQTRCTSWPVGTAVKFQLCMQDTVITLSGLKKDQLFSSNQVRTRGRMCQVRTAVKERRRTLHAVVDEDEQFAQCIDSTTSASDPFDEERREFSLTRLGVAALYDLLNLSLDA